MRSPAAWMLPAFATLAVAAGAESGWTLRRGPDGVERCYAATRRLDLPYKVIEPSAAPLQSLKLYLSRDGGKTWKEEAEIPTDRPLRFEAPEDGEYGFSICGIDSVGNALPAPTAGEAPQLRVVVDTFPPIVRCETAEGEAVRTRPVRVSWTARDAGGVDAVRLETSLDSGQHWEEAAKGEATGAAEWTVPAEAAETVLLRAVARDFAGHRTVSPVLRLPVGSLKEPEPTPPAPLPVPVPEPPPAPPVVAEAHPPAPVPAPAPTVEPLGESAPEPDPDGPSDPERARTHFLRAGLLRRNGLVPEAEAEYRLAIAAAPRMSGPHNDLGIMLFRSGKVAAGITALLRARELAPDDADVAFNLGFALYAADRLEEALPHLARSGPGGEPRFYLASTLGRLGRFDEALETLKDAASLGEPWGPRCRKLADDLKAQRRRKGP